MATAVQRRRGTSVEHLTFTGLLGEVTVDTDKNVAVVHDGATAGGIPLLRQDADNYDGSEINNFRSQAIDDNVTNHTVQLTLTDAGITVGSPTGGAAGAGTLNAAGLFVNGSAVPAVGINQNITADWLFSGDVTFTGDVTNVSSTDTFVRDKLLTLNDQEILNGVTGGVGTSGLRVDRGFSSSAVATTGDLTFADANPDTIKRASGDWTADGVIAGSYVSISGSAQNDGVYLVASVSTTDSANDTIVLDTNENLQADGPETVSTVTILNSANTQASLIFDEADDTWKLGLVGSESAIATAASPATTISVGDTSVVVSDTGADGTITFTTDGTLALTINNAQDSTFEGRLLLNGTQHILAQDAASALVVSGGTGSGVGGNLILYGESHATRANDFTLRTTATEIVSWDDSADSLIFRKNSTLTTLMIDTNSDITIYGDIFRSADNELTVLSGGTSAILGGNVVLYGESHATKANVLEFYGAAALALTIDTNQNVIVGSSELADAATDGFFYIPTTTTGLPTGVPTSFAGRVPMVYDDTNSELYIYNGSWLPAGAADGDGLAYAIAFGG